MSPVDGFVIPMAVKNLPADRPMTRPTLAFVVGAALVLAPASIAHAAPRKPIIGRATISPKSLPGSGGSAQVTLTVASSGGGSVTGVFVTASLPDGDTSGRVALAATGPGTYSGTVLVPANEASHPVRARLVAEVEATGGSAARPIGAVRLEGAARP